MYNETNEPYNISCFTALESKTVFTSYSRSSTSTTKVHFRINLKGHSSKVKHGTLDENAHDKGNQDE